MAETRPPTNDTDLIVVCAAATDPLYWPDNVRGLCSRCGRAVQHRPDVPRPHRLMCLPCASDGLDTAERIIVTRQTLLDLLAYQRRN